LILFTIYSQVIGWEDWVLCTIQAIGSEMTYNVSSGRETLVLTAYLHCVSKKFSPLNSVTLSNLNF